MSQFKQEYPEIKKEADTSSEKDFEEINMGFRIVKQEKLDNNNHQQKQDDVKKSPVPTVVEDEEEDIEDEEEANTVNLINESGDESVTTTTSKRKSNDSSDDVIELSDNSILDMPLGPPPVKRFKLLEKPVCTPKKSPTNSYKSLIKQSNNSATFSNGIAQTAKSKLISPTSTINKSTIRRKNIFKAKTAFKTIRFAASKAKRRALKKKKKTPIAVEIEKSTNAENVEPIEVGTDDDNSSTAEKSSDVAEVEEQHEERSMDGSSEYSGKSNIDLTIERVAKGYFSESEVFSSLAKYRKTKSQKKFEAKLLDLCAKQREKKNKKIEKEEKTQKKKDVFVVVEEVEKPKNKSKKKKKPTKKAPPVEIVTAPLVVEKKVSKNKKSKAKEEPLKSQLKKTKVEEVPTTHSTPKKKAQKAPKNVKKAESPVIESDDDVTIVTAATKDEDTSTTLISSTKTEQTTSAPPLQPPPESSEIHLDETDVANNNDEYFKDHNQRQKHEPLTLYKTPGYGWTMALNKSSNKRGKKAKYSKTKKLRVTLPNDIVIPKSTSIPRWSNGWVWEGEPYQALVFLNVSNFNTNFSSFN